MLRTAAEHVFFCVMIEERVLHFCLHFYRLGHLPVPLIGTGLLTLPSKHSFVGTKDEFLQP